MRWGRLTWDDQTKEINQIFVSQRLITDHKGSLLHHSFFNCRCNLNIIPILNIKKYQVAFRTYLWNLIPPFRRFLTILQPRWNVPKADVCTIRFCKYHSKPGALRYLTGKISLKKNNMKEQIHLFFYYKLTRRIEKRYQPFPLVHGHRAPSTLTKVWKHPLYVRTERSCLPYHNLYRKIYHLGINKLPKHYYIDAKHPKTTKN